MAQTWQVDAGLSTQPSLSPAAVSQLFAALQSPQPARCMLHFINTRVPVEYLSMVQYESEVPRQIEAHELNPQQEGLTRLCFSLYQTHFRWADPIPQQARAMRHQSAANPSITAHLLPRHDIPHDGWRHTIFEAHRLVGRLSLLYTPTPRSVFALNLYRHDDQGPFQPHEVGRLMDIAPLLQQVHHQALGMAERLPRLDDRVAAGEHRLTRLAPQLTPRERQVCARIAAGITADGIAADLGIASSTVITLRKRAYAKLGVMDRLSLARLIY